MDLTIRKPVPPPETDERVLISRARTDRAAFAALYRRHARDVASLILRRIGDVHATEDLTAEVFVVALDRLPRYEARPSVPFRHWLAGIASRLVSQWIRRRRRRIDRERRYALLRGGACPSREPDFIETESLRSAFVDLKVEWQTALSLHYFEGYSVEEIARLLRCLPGTVKSRLSRGRAALRARLQQED